MTTVKRWLRFKVQGTHIKVWIHSTPEPANGQTALIDSTIAEEGVLQLKWLRGGVATSAGEVLVDNLQVTTYQAEA